MLIEKEIKKSSEPLKHTFSMVYKYVGSNALLLFSSHCTVILISRLHENDQVNYCTESPHKKINKLNSCQTIGS